MESPQAFFGASKDYLVDVEYVHSLIRQLGYIISKHEIAANCPESRIFSSLAGFQSAGIRDSCVSAAASLFFLNAPRRFHTNQTCSVSDMMAINRVSKMEISERRKKPLVAARHSAPPSKPPGVASCEFPVTEITAHAILPLTAF